MKVKRARALAALMLCWAGCKGTLTGDGPPGTDPGDPTTPVEPTEPWTPPGGGVTVDPSLFPDASCRPEVARIWALTPEQLEATYASVIEGFPQGIVDTALRPYVGRGEPYSNDPAILNGGPQYMSRLIGSVGALVDRSISDERVEGPPCIGTDDASCRDTLLSAFASTLYRRELTAEERDAHVSFYDAIAAAQGAGAANRLLARRLLTAPTVIFREELGGEPGDDSLAVLTPRERADLLSYTLLDAPPDDELTAAAADGTLADPAVLEAQVRRLVGLVPEDVTLEDAQDERSITGIMRFFYEWLDVEDIRFAEGLRFEDNGAERNLRWLSNEPMMFVREVLWNNDARLETLLNANFTMYSRTLSDYYGRAEREAPSPSPTLQGRRGLLMQGGWLISHKGITARGVWIREKLFCQEVPSPPGVDMNLTGLEEDLEVEEGRDLSPREVRERHMSEPSCQNCHAVIDPLGYPFDGFATNGTPREDVEGFPLELEGWIESTANTDGAVSGPQELVATLARSPDVRGCFVEQLYGYVHGRHIAEHDTCYVDGLKARFEETDGDIRDLIVQIFLLENMTRRVPFSALLTEEDSP
ncbi:MAG: DUF1592 domain-containing protein [Myxococcota bacterium]